MINWAGCNDGQYFFSDPFPENNVLCEFNVFEFGLFIHVKDLKNVSFSLIGGFQGNNIVLDVHYGSINFSSWSLDNIHFIEKFNDTQLWSISLINISDTDVSFRFEMSDIEFEEFRINT